MTGTKTINEGLGAFRREMLEFHGVRRTVFARGSGPPVIVMHEVPGLHPDVIRLAKRIERAGMSVWLPSIFGTPGRPANAAYVAASMLRACVMKEFSVLALNRNSAVASWMSALAAHLNARGAGSGVGAVGMCITGSIALSMVLEDSVLAPVLCNPSLPFALTPARRRDCGVDAFTLDHVRRRCANEGLCVLGLRFTRDPAVPKPRFDRLRRELGGNFRVIEIDNRAANPHGIPFYAHSVLGMHHVDDALHPTANAEAEVVRFLAERLIGSQPTTA